MADKYDYEKIVDGKRKVVGKYTIDSDRSITGKYVVNVKAYFDENPEERIRLGWTKHIYPDAKPLYNRQTHYLVTLPRQVDEYTIVDEYHPLPKTEEMLELEEMLESLGVWGDWDSETDDYLGAPHLHFFG